MNPVCTTIPSEGKTAISFVPPDGRASRSSGLESRHRQNHDRPREHRHAYMMSHQCNMYMSMYMYGYVYVCICISIYLSVYIYIYRERESYTHIHIYIYICFSFVPGARLPFSTCQVCQMQASRALELGSLQAPYRQPQMRTVLAS